MSSSSVGDRKLEELTHELESERSSSQVLVKKLDGQVLITNKTELAFNTQTDFINAKNEIIRNLIIKIHDIKKKYLHSCRPYLEYDLTSHLESNSSSNSRTENNKGVQDC